MINFGNDFGERADIGDTIETTCGPVRFVATLYRDDDRSKPDERQDGFWPSLDPEDCGYIGPKSKATLARHMAYAESVMADFKAGRMFYVGVAVRAFLGDGEDVPLSGEYDSALWGIECNQDNFRKRRDKRGRNAYLRDVANELLPDVLETVADLLEADSPEWLAQLAGGAA